MQPTVSTAALRGRLVVRHPSFGVVALARGTRRRRRRRWRWWWGLVLVAHAACSPWVELEHMAFGQVRSVTGRAEHVDAHPYNLSCLRMESGAAPRCAPSRPRHALGLRRVVSTHFPNGLRARQAGPFAPGSTPPVRDAKRRTLAPFRAHVPGLGSSTGVTPRNVDHRKKVIPVTTPKNRPETRAQQGFC